MPVTNQKINLKTIIKCPFFVQTIGSQRYIIIPAYPATGILYITENTPYFISGHVRMKGREEGKYPCNYLGMINTIFGYENNTIEVCSRSIRGLKSGGDCLTVDINPNCNPDIVTDGQSLDDIPNISYNRWRCDPPYNERTAKKMYSTTMPNIGKLLKTGIRICKPKSLLFLLLGPLNYQWCPPGVKRIGWVAITIVPNNELRALHIYYKLQDVASIYNNQYKKQKS